jgi:hypothetical protein
MDRRARANLPTHLAGLDQYIQIPCLAAAAALVGKERVEK